MNITTEGTLLGKNIEVKTSYDPSVLVAVPRAANRDQYQIVNEFMKGADVWRCYECSTLLENGAPLYFGMVINYPSDSEFIVESKSLKLYLNSFNMTKVKNREMVFDTVSRDLSKLLKTKVKTYPLYEPGVLDEDWVEMQSMVDYSKIDYFEYNESRMLLNVSPHFDHKNFRWVFNGFRSNCKVTNAPDYATVFIEYDGREGVDPVALIRYLTSYRNEQHLHEECCELIFNRMMNFYDPEFLRVTCAYTRRGGIDITPTRWWSKSGQTYIDNIPRTEYQ